MSELPSTCAVPEACKPYSEGLEIRSDDFLVQHLDVLEKEEENTLRVTLCMMQHILLGNGEACPIRRIYMKRFEVFGKIGLPGREYFSEQKLKDFGFLPSDN